MLVDFAKTGIERSSPRKSMDGSHSIYMSRRFRRPIAGRGYGLPILCDFGQARIGETQESGPFVQPHICRAPEVIIEMPWGSAVDIWNLACLLSTMLSFILQSNCQSDPILARFGTFLKERISLKTSLMSRMVTILSSTSHIWVL